jgi:hypothetical protein
MMSFSPAYHQLHLSMQLKTHSGMDKKTANKKDGSQKILATRTKSDLNPGLNTTRQSPVFESLVVT